MEGQLTRTGARFTLSAMFKWLSVASLITTSAVSRAMTLDQRSSQEALGERFTDLVSRITAAEDVATRSRIINEFCDRLTRYGKAIVEDSSVVFLYKGEASRVSVVSDLNGWTPNVDTLKQLDDTDLHYLVKNVDIAARFEYKIVADSNWMLDQFNQQQALGGYGPNSEIWMPAYVPPKEILYRPEIEHGRIDTISLKSSTLGRTHIAFVYLPPGYSRSRSSYPCIYVTDGGEYLTLALMHNVLDNLVADGRIKPVVGIFIDPRTDIRDSETSKRMHDYTMSDSFVTFLVDEVRERIRKSYRVRTEPENTAIMGASLGGLIATYASFRRPDIFGLCAAQSPSYWWKEGAMVKLVDESPRRDVRLYIDTGTIRDAREYARLMHELLLDKGYNTVYGEYPEGHNWVNWRARVDDILLYFWGTP